MAENKKISVVIASYNRVGKLRECLKALSRQTLDADLFEVIVVNDNSSEDYRTLEIEFENKQPAVFFF